MANSTASVSSLVAVLLDGEAATDALPTVVVVRMRS
jgi:hypothetical protein